MAAVSSYRLLSLSLVTCGLLVALSEGESELSKIGGRGSLARLVSELGRLVECTSLPLSLPLSPSLAPSLSPPLSPPPSLSPPPPSLSPPLSLPPSLPLSPPISAGISTGSGGSLCEECPAGTYANRSKPLQYNITCVLLLISLYQRLIITTLELHSFVKQLLYKSLNYVSVHSAMSTTYIYASMYIHFSFVCVYIYCDHMMCVYMYVHSVCLTVLYTYVSTYMYTYNITGKEVCSECDDPGWCRTASDCSECDAGSSSGAGSSNCTLCDKGTFAK